MGVVMTGTARLVEEVKAAGEDFEWYPTTRAMVAAVYRCMRGCDRGGVSVLDVGAGDGRLFTILDELAEWQEYPATVNERFAIEKSQRLIQAMPPEVCIVGTDFETDTLIDKKVDVVFCNPPYSNYSAWSEKVIREANAATVYLVIPERWQSDAGIAAAIERRGATSRVVHSDTFENAERRARARVDVVQIRMQKQTSYYGESAPDTDPFAIWFDEHFPMKEEETESAKEAKEEAQKAHFVAQGRNQVEVLAECYRADLDHLLENYKAAGQMDAEILRELGVSVATLRDGLKSKIGGLKCHYWRELFEKMESITKRLTETSRAAMLERLQTHTQVDFTVENAYAVVMWALKNANRYIDTQLLDLYMRMSSQENCRGYKSNRHFESDTWRYCRGDEFWETHHHYALEYRLVLENTHAIEPADPWLRCDYDDGLHKDAHNYLGDIFVVARNLGYDVMDGTRGREWESNQEEEFLYWTDDGPELFARVRAFKNGNIHIKACKGFMQALNIEAGRLNGWIRSAGEAAAQLALPVETCEAHFGCNLQLTGSALLLPAAVA